MKQIDNDAIQKLVLVLESVLLNNFSTEEKKWFSKIEELRQELLSSNEKVTYIDFGAGKPNNTRTKEDMEKGVVTSNTVGEISQRDSSPVIYAKLLFKLIKEFQLTRGIELGTCLGISASYESSAMELNQNGTLITCEGAKSLAEISIRNLSKLGLSRCEVKQGRFSDTLPDILKNNQPIDFAFIDGHHDETATLEYFRLMIPYLADFSILVFDDISWSSGMKKAWIKIKEFPNILATVDLKKFGIVIFDRKIPSDNSSTFHFQFYLN